jgi:flagellum-specific peptidoglycan hydrolase FlgJ
MRRKVFHQMMICAFGVALLLTLGMRFQSPPIHSEDSSFKLAFVHFPITPIITPQIPPADKTEKAQEKKPVSEAVNDQKPTLKTESTSTTYEVTAYYLNVRANPDKKSKILNVIKKGTMIDVQSQSDNGWLKIKEGGYVHGGYARKVSGELKIAEQEEPLTGRTAKAGNVLRTQDEGDPSKPTSAVGTDSGLTEADITLIFDGTALAGHGLEETILEVEEQYGINALFTIAVMKLESGNGSSRLAKSKNNLFGLNAITGDKNNRAFSFESKGDSVRKFGQLLSKNYVGKGYTTVEKIARKYCPANSNWSGLVKNIMKKDFGRLNVT